MKAVLMLAHPATGMTQGSSPAVEVTFLTSSHWTKGLSHLILGIIKTVLSWISGPQEAILFLFCNDYFDIY